MRYQITESKNGAKSLLLDWLRRCLPEKTINNFTTDWKDGFLLSSLVNFCDSSLIIDHLWLESDEGLENLENALNMAEKYLGVPPLLQPQDFLIEKPDGHSIMTYLSYFCNGPDSPGQKKLLSWIHDQTNDETILDFSNAWIDGSKLGLLTSVVSSGEYEDSENETATHKDVVDYCRSIMEAADKLLGIDMIVTPEEFADHSFNSLVRMMYILQFYFSTVQAKVHELHIPEEPGLGATAWLDVFLPDGSTSTINAVVNGKLVGEVPVNTELLDDGKHRIKFDAEIQDKYILNVSVGGTRIKGSPFTIDLTDPDPNSVKVTNTIFPKKSGIPVIMTVKAKNSSHGELSGSAVGKICGDVPFLKEIDSPTSYKVSFIPWQADTYVVDIRLDGQHIKGSPYTFDLTNLIQPEMVSIRKPEKGEVGQPITVPIDARAGGNGIVTVKCSGEKAGDVEVFLNEPQNPTKITFTPPVEDIYILSVFFDNSEVMGSPMKINLSADATKVRLSRPPSAHVSAGQEVRIGFDTSDAGIGEMTASCAGQNIGDIKVDIIQDENSYEIVFVPPKGDIYNITVLWSDTPVTGSPFKMNLVPKDLPDPKKCKIIGFPEASTLLLVNEAVEFKVDATNAGRGYLDVVIEIENDDQDANEDDRLSVVSTGTRGSEYSNMLDVEMDEEELEPIHEEEDDGDAGDLDNHHEKNTGEEERIEVQNSDEIEPPKADDINATDEADVKAKNEEMPITGQEDADINMTENSLDDIKKFLADADIEDETKTAPTLNIVKSDENPKIYNVTFVPVQKGNHSINIYWADQPISDAKLLLNVFAPQIVYFNNPISVPVKTKYKRKNLKVQIQKRDATSVHKQVKMDKIKTGDYLLIFTPEQPGIYLMHVTAKSKPIRGSPFVISYIQHPKDLDVKVTHIQSSVYVGERVNFVIETKGEDLQPDDLSVIRRPSLNTSEVDTSEENFTVVHLQRNKDGTLTAEYTPSDAGEELVEVRVRNKAILGSPFKISVKSKDALKKVKKDDIFGLQLEEYKFIVGEPNNLKLFCKELGEGEMEVLCKPSTHADIVVVPDASEEKVYWVEIKPKKSGKASLFVRYGGANIFGSPFNVNFLARGNAKKCVLLTTTDCVHDPSEEEKIFCVTTKGAGKGKITAAMKVLLRNKHINVRVDQHSKNHYHIKFVPTEGLNYMLSVRFDDIDIQGSPYKILLGNPSQCKVEGEGLISPWSGKLNIFYVDSESAGPGELSVVIEGDEEDVFDKKAVQLEPKIRRLEEFKYEVSYKPDVPGIYWVDTKWNDVSIPESPFKTTCKKPLSYEQLSIKDVASITHHGKRVKMIVQVDQVIEENDKLRVALFSEGKNMMKYPGEVTRKDDQSYLISIQPPKLGDYTVYVLWDEQHVSSSPFKIQNLPPPSPSDFFVEAAEGDQGEIAVNVIGPVFSYKYGELTASFCHTSTNISDDAPVNINPLTDTDCAVNFKPNRGGEYILSIYYDKEHIEGSPFTVVSTDASQCRSKGKGLSIARINHDNKFAVFTENAGPGELRVEIDGEAENEGGVLIDPEIITMNNTRYDVSYRPQLPGKYTISIFWDTQHIPESPFEVNCCDPSRYSLVNPPKEGALGVPVKIGVMESSPAPSFEQLEVFTFGKDRMAHNGKVNKGDDGYYLVTVQPPELGKYLVHIRCNSYDIKGSPFKIKNMPAPIPEKVVVSGSGIHDGVVGKGGLFQIDISEAGHGFISLKVQGPKGGFQVNITHSREDDRLILADYNPMHSGSYSIDVLWSGVRVPNSPFVVNIIDGESNSSVQNRNATTQSAAV